MTPDTQEALSHQHSNGIWVVALDSGNLAVFLRPNGPLLTILNGPFPDSLVTECANARLRYEDLGQRPPKAAAEGSSRGALDDLLDLLR
jgi:hypothetical protein